ncbi:MAG: hypothetical protein PWQ67_1428 [Clostridia bacterium]|jgi:hypothetical protein|nr:hypothetical protein [Clostridia bacterium]MDN5322974.1 hypothetical protein [Clostridia bacterium]
MPKFLGKKPLISRVGANYSPEKVELKFFCIKKAGFSPFPLIKNS